MVLWYLYETWLLIDFLCPRPQMDDSLKPCLTGVSKSFARCIEQIKKASRGDLSPEELKERQVWTYSNKTLVVTLTNGPSWNWVSCYFPCLRPRECRTLKFRTSSKTPL